MVLAATVCGDLFCGGGHGFCLYPNFTENLVSGVAPAGVDAAGLDFRPGLDGVVLNDGAQRVADMAHCRLAGSGLPTPKSCCCG